MKKSLSEKLADNLAYYINKPERRCIDNQSGCYYSGDTAGKKTMGCFVGKLLSPKDRITADQQLISTASGATGVHALVNYAGLMGIKVPNLIKKNVDVMSTFQILHDNCENWDENGLSEEGKIMLTDIINKYNLEKKYFDKFLVD